MDNTTYEFSLQDAGIVEDLSMEQIPTHGKSYW
jgi:hypothetical protein